MLAPDDRRPLLESLRPPEGYQLDYAVATTFSLDLVALLTAPVAFTFHDWEHSDGRPVVEPLALLESLSRYADRMTVFYQADRISVPNQAHQLFGFLERQVIPVRAQHEAGLFHPKAWALRYAAPDQPVRYRLLVSSRNLTFDRSWDTLLVLDGVLEDRKVGFGNLRPIGEFFDALLGLAVQRIPKEISRRVQEIAAEVRRVRFDLPQGVEDVAFWPLGIGRGRRWPFSREGRRLVVVSPFLTEHAVARLGSLAPECVLVSEVGELDRLGSEAVAAFGDIRVLNPAARPVEPDEQVNPLVGLHAKLYVLEQGKTAEVWTGSANATDAGFGINVELLAELRGSRKALGVEALLGERAGGTSFASLLEPYTPADEPQVDEDGEVLARLVDSIRVAIGRLPLGFHVSTTDETDTFNLTLKGPRLALETDGADVALACRPISLGEAMAASLTLNEPVQLTFPKISYQAITSFAAFTVSATRAGKTLREQFVVNLPLSGEPADRRQRIIQTLLSDERSVLRFILLLLAGDAELSAAAFAERGSGTDSKWQWGFGDATILESLLQALVRAPARLDRLAQLLEDLRAGDNPLSLPENFLTVWKPIWAARQELAT